MTPNQVSVASVFAAGAAAFCYVSLAWPWNALVGLSCQIAWHVLDGADGDLARRTGRASPVGELVDGVCDHLSQALIYVAFALTLQPHLHAWAWIAASVAGASHFIQANAYETGRKAYRAHVYGALWMRQTGTDLTGPGRLLAGLYMAVSALASPGEAAIERAMAAAIASGPTGASGARDLYQRRFAPLVKASGVLGSNARTLATFLAVLAGRPLWFFIFEMTALNLAFIALAWRRGLANHDLAGRLPVQAGAAPN